MKVSIQKFCLAAIAVFFLAAVAQSPSASGRLGDTGTQLAFLNHPYLKLETINLANGADLVKMAINGPSRPPAGIERPVAALPAPGQASMVNSLSVPAYTWVFGCSAVSAAMIAGYYDRLGYYPDIYTGPTNGGVMPMTGSWPYWMDGAGDSYPLNPLIASKQELDGRSSRGSLEDYWVAYNSSAKDPFITNNWSEHAWGDAIGDYMKTSQSQYGNPDGQTLFYGQTTPPGRLDCSEMVAAGVSDLDGTYGRKLFYESRGYTVTDCYNQFTDNIISGGFSYAMYKAEIDAGHPVLLNLNGHSIVGIGYDPLQAYVYVYDTWDEQVHTFTWGGSYAYMQLAGVSIVNLTPVLPTAFYKNGPENGAVKQPNDLTLTWGNSDRVDRYEYCVDLDQNGVCNSGWVDASSSTSAALSGLYSGAAYSWQVRARNVTGAREADNDDWWSFTVEPQAPALSDFSPKTGPAGTGVVLTGDNFYGATSVQFNGAQAAFTLDSAWQIHTAVPQGAASGKITLVTSGGTVESSANFIVVPTAQFSAVNYPADEAAGTVTVSITIDVPPAETVSLHYSTSDGSAEAGKDYISSSGVLTFTPNVMVKTVNVEIINDRLDEADTETILLTLSDAAGCVLGQNRDVTLTIADDDPQPEIRFSHAAYPVMENAGTVPFTVTLSAPSERTITVAYRTTNGSAAAGYDYVLAYGTLTFEPGVTVLKIQVQLLNNTMYEPAEYFNILLSYPVNAVFSAPIEAVCTITDDDLTGWSVFVPLVIK